MNLPQGFLLSAIGCGIKKKGLDLGLILCGDGANAAGVFTQNVNPSYSVEISKRHINNTIHALIVNSGNANCFTQKKDLGNTFKICESLARHLGIKKENTLLRYSLLPFFFRDTLSFFTVKSDSLRP